MLHMIYETYNKWGGGLTISWRYGSKKIAENSLDTRTKNGRSEDFFPKWWWGLAKNACGHMFSFVKLNFNTSLFSWILLLEHNSIPKLRLYIFSVLKRENVQNKGRPQWKKNGFFWALAGWWGGGSTHARIFWPSF